MARTRSTVSIMFAPGDREDNDQNARLAVSQANVAYI